MTPDGFTSAKPTYKNLRFAEGPRRGIRPRADLYLPSGGKEHPSVVLIHGGAYLIGSKSMKPMRFLATHLVAAGYAVLSINYRMIFRGGRFSQSREDVANAVNWWLENAARYGCDAARVSLLGMSAGAALMLDHIERSERHDLKSLISVYGVYDFTYLSGRATRWLRTRMFLSKEPAIWASASVVERCHTPLPLLLLHGDCDTIVPVEHAHKLLSHRHDIAQPTDSLVSKGAGHSFFNEPNHPATIEGLQKILDFLRENDAGRQGAS